MTAGRTLFPTRVFDADAVPRVLVSGVNNAKLGGRVTKGPWRDMPIFSVTLEERATCPRSCGLWRECFGSAMPLARRVRHGPALVDRLGHELAQKAREHPGGFVIRLHFLGDFYEPAYLQAWLGWLRQMPQLRVFGYTAHARGTPLGDAIAAANETFPGRWAVRTSVGAEAAADPWQATTIWRAPEQSRVAEGIVCPAQTGGTECCASCGLCWLPAASALRVVFVGHGMNRGARSTTSGVVQEEQQNQRR